jgi:hypothetical protein
MSILWRILPVSLIVNVRILISYRENPVSLASQTTLHRSTSKPRNKTQAEKPQLTSPKKALRSSSSLTYCTPTSRSVINTGGGGCFLLSFFEFVNFGCGGGWSDLVGMLNETG